MLGWMKAWNKIIREIIFHDYKLKRLMMVPPKTGVVQFCDRYFIRAGFTNKTLTNEICRIIYSDVQGSQTEVPNVKKNLMTFDIYVREDELHTAGDDALMFRTQLIAARLYELLTKERYLLDTGYRFWPAGDWDLGTRTSGYARYTISFYYMKVY